MGAYTIELWLRGMVDYDIPDSTLKSILFNNNIDFGADAKGLTEKERDLCLADLYMWLSASSTSTSGESVSDGGWQHTKSNKVVTDKAILRQKASALYAKWDSPKVAEAIPNRITVKALY